MTVQLIHLIDTEAPAIPDVMLGENGIEELRAVHREQVREVNNQIAGLTPSKAEGDQQTDPAVVPNARYPHHRHHRI